MTITCRGEVEHRLTCSRLCNLLIRDGLPGYADVDVQFSKGRKSSVRENDHVLPEDKVASWLLLLLRVPLGLPHSRRTI